MDTLLEVDAMVEGVRGAESPGTEDVGGDLGAAEGPVEAAVRVLERIQ